VQSAIEFRLGVFDPLVQVPFAKIPAAVIASAKHREVSCQALLAGFHDGEVRFAILTFQFLILNVS
jgi:hypothetical protein